MLVDRLDQLIDFRFEREVVNTGPHTIGAEKGAGGITLGFESLDQLTVGLGITGKAIELKGHQTRFRGTGAESVDLGQGLELGPEFGAEGLDAVIAIDRAAPLILESEGSSESSVERVSRGGDFVAFAIGQPAVGVSIGSETNTTPADETGVKDFAGTGTDVEATETFRTTPPFVAGESVKIHTAFGEVEGENADGLGRVDEEFDRVLALVLVAELDQIS